MALNELYADMWNYVENQLSHGPLRDTLLVFRSEVAQIEAENERLRAKLWWIQTAPPLRAEEIPVDVVEKYRQYLASLRGETC